MDPALGDYVTFTLFTPIYHRYDVLVDLQAVNKNTVCLSVCQAVRRAARGRLQLHTYAHNMQTKNLKALCYKAAWLAPIDSLVQNQLAPLLFILDKK